MLTHNKRCDLDGFAIALCDVHVPEKNKKERKRNCNIPKVRYSCLVPSLEESTGAVSVFWPEEDLYHVASFFGATAQL